MNKEKQKQWVKNNPEKVKLSQKKYNEKHPEKRKASALNWKNKNPNYHKEWYQKNKTKVLIESKNWYQDNKTKKQDYLKKWRSETQYNKKYYAANKEKLSQYHKEYHERNREILIKKMKENYDPVKRKVDYLKNREENLLRVKEWRLKNADHLKQYQKEFEQRPERKAYHKKWNDANPRKSHGGSYSLDLEIAMNNVRIRDNNTCQWQGCGLTHKKGFPIHVHHIFPRSEYPGLQLEEKYLICYCANHHYIWHRFRGDQAAHFLKTDLESIQYLEEYG